MPGEPQPINCAVCNRVVMSDHVNARRECVLCESPEPSAKPKPSSTPDTKGLVE